MNSQEKLIRPLVLFFAGLHFGIIQSALYFEVLVNVTATFMGYFLIMLTWMLGVVYYLKFYKKKNFLFFLSLSIISYYALLIFTNVFNTSIYLFILMLPFIFLSASVVGEFFKEYSHRVSGRALFFHENNGFVFGMILSIVFFTSFGINFLWVVPFVSYLILYLVFREKIIPSFAILTLVFLFSLLFQHWLIALLLGLLIFSGIIFLFIKTEPVSAISKTEDKLIEIKDYQKKGILFIAGLNLILLQYFIVREFSSILSANELSIMLVSVVYFFGFSIGYYLSKQISINSLKVISCCMLFIHIFIFVFIKVNAAQMISTGYGYEALLLLFITVAFITSGFYSIFLPKFIELTGAEFIKNAYSWELFGAIIGVGLIYFVVLFSLSFLWSLYFLLLLILIFILINKSKWAFSYFLIGIFTIGIFTIHHEKIFKYSTEDYYKSRGYKNPKVLFSGNSFYHSVEVIDTYFDKTQRVPKGRVSFINGIRYFQYKYDLSDGFYQPTALSEFTYYLAELPAKYLSQKLDRKLRILILGGGSLYSLNRVAPYSEKTTLVEIDPIVVEAAKKCWPEFNKYDKLDNYEIVIDDAKHYLKASDEKFDLIIMDISAPYYLGTALLHNEDFFRLIKTKLGEDGVFSESTQNRPQPKYPNSMAMKIFKSVRNVFPKYLLIDSKNKSIGKHGFLFATTNWDISSNEVVEIMKKDNRYKGTSTYSEKSKYFNFDETIPISLTNMESLLSYNNSRIVNRLKLKKRAVSTAGYSKSKRVSTDDSNLFRAIAAKIREPNFKFKVLFILIVAIILRYIPSFQKIVKPKKKERL
ncbi:MAG: fused MFS/spermidine synthase [Melioribacteraceae bacterium]|nr:fused MFS/spermidine synthase [Melioribacteraceae bacterium]